jgi:2-polyprenyl-3-methyl-5-hydroxy-6-metoxy-1,4-benzoquinol methylase
MNIESFSDVQIIESWRDNATPWTEVVRAKAIESRRQVTDQAIVDVVLSQAPRSVLDLGCGEGWLARELLGRGIEVMGVDVVPELVEFAQQSSGGDFRVLSYEQIASGELQVSVDAMVCNFSLLGKESVDGIFRTCPSLLNKNGVLIVQTVHPVVACGEQPYQDGWRPGSWSGCGSAKFSKPAPWYFRTVASWQQLFAGNALQLLDTCEPLNPQTQQPASIIFVARSIKEQ